MATHRAKYHSALKMITSAAWSNISLQEFGMK